ncbi:CshA/CshB family fibrillar adhesin-related protein [Sphingomonadaceae bacterium]|nr:CshA/CshB family fibrillar adhesin-related protein [Sphingomonadaceae bacterium]
MFTLLRYGIPVMLHRALSLRSRLAAFIALICGSLMLAISPVQAQSADCSPAASPGDAPPAWQTYCWLDFSGYNDAAARSAGGQAFSFLLSDGSSLQFTVNTTTTTASGADDRPAPSWTGAAVGNSSFLGIPGRPILYMANSGATVNFTFSNITIVPPPGVASVTDFAFVVADGESTDNSEFLNFTTNGGNWEILDVVPPITGSQYPVLTGTGTSALGMSGGGQSGRIGAYIAASNKPTTVTAEMKGQRPARHDVRDPLRLDHSDQTDHRCTG